MSCSSCSEMFPTEANLILASYPWMFDVNEATVYGSVVTCQTAVVVVGYLDQVSVLYATVYMGGII